MRKLVLLACSIAVAAAVGASSSGADVPGSLSVDQGRGVVTLDLRGVVLGRLGNGSLRVTDVTPRDPFGEIVTGRNLLAEERVGPRTVIYRGQGLRFRMLGGRYRVRLAGTGIDVSAVGRGVVALDGERKGDESTGLYSVTGADCEVEPALCTPLPDEREQFTLGTPIEGG
jgi:hypothetical protein